MCEKKRRDAISDRRAETTAIGLHEAATDQEAAEAVSEASYGDAQHRRILRPKVSVATLKS